MQSHITKTKPFLGGFISLTIIEIPHKKKEEKPLTLFISIE